MPKKKEAPTGTKPKRGKGGAPKGNRFAKGNDGGRPTLYKKEYADMAFRYCLLGSTDADLARIFSVSEVTINDWKNKHKEFLKSIHAGKEQADSIVAGELYKGSQDRIVTEQQAIKVKSVSYNAKGQRIEKEEVEIVEVKKVIPADFRNQQFWLRNRKPDKWREKQDMDVTTGGESLNRKITPSEARELIEKIKAGEA